MQVAQRGTSSATNLTGISSPEYRIQDRWNFQGVLNLVGSWTQSHETDAPTGSGFRNSMKFTCTTSRASLDPASQLIIKQELEGQDLQRIAKGTSSAQQLTLTFWVKSNVTGTYIAELYDRDNTRQVSKSYTISASATWEKKTLTFPADTTGAFDNDNNASLFVAFYLLAGTNYTSGTLNTSWASVTTANRAVGQTNLAAATNNYWQVTGVQLEVGPVATPFEFESYGDTLRKCQRYYTRITADAATRYFGWGFAISGTQATVQGQFPVPMRVRPTAVEQPGTAGDYRLYTPTSYTCSAVPAFDTSTSAYFYGVTFTIGTNSLTAGGGVSGASTVANAYLGWSAEL